MAKVQLESGKSVKMSELKIGDRVHTGMDSISFLLLDLSKHFFIHYFKMEH